GESVENGNNVVIQDWVAAADSECCIVRLLFSQSGVVECPHPSLIQRKLGTHLIETDAGQCLATAKCRQGLAEDRVLLALLILQLREQSRNSRGVGLIDAAACYQLVDQVLDVLSTERCQRTCRNVEYIELIRNVYS